MPPGELPLSHAVHRLLTQHGVETMDQLDQPRVSTIRGHVEWTKGVGPAKVILTAERLLDWLEENRNMEARNDDKKSSHGASSRKKTR